ncbi:hypothetical protein L1987_23032 [Smallanthus sonchifolius]|uniref:Uncharacterized protein n=1 Tax=Smallanthus sonchifolius TaxID=185202 RepID=A0ACB9II91_9ASTR|nr:hypothetical protein L1987_23032 [Smallanthus sonchifolius]
MSNSRGLGAIGSWLHKKVVDPFIQILQRGVEPKQLAFSTALGISLGVFPIVGILMVVFLRFGEFDALKKVLTGEASTEIIRSILNAVFVGVVGFGTLNNGGTLHPTFTLFCDRGA